MLKADMQDEIDRLQNEVEQARDELTHLKRQVAEKARDLAEEHDWCSVVKTALTDLGIEWPEQEVNFTIEIRAHVTATTSAVMSTDLETFIYQSIEGVELDGTDQIKVRLDEDWGRDTRADVIDVYITNVE